MGSEMCIRDRVQTGVNAKAGWLGENSTEVFGFTDENINQGK